MAVLVRIAADPGHGFFATIPCLPSCSARGATEEEVLRKIAEAAQEKVRKCGGWLKVKIEDYERKEGARYEVVEFYGRG